MTPTGKKHLVAIYAGEITKTNVIGLRKAINAVYRRNHLYSLSRAQAAWAPLDVHKLETALASVRPLVTGELHDSGIKLLQSRRYAKRLEAAGVADIVADLAKFQLLRFDRIGERGQYAIAVYRAVSKSGKAFAFRNIPWQSGGNGPEIVRINY